MLEKMPVQVQEPRVVPTWGSGPRFQALEFRV